MGYVRNKHCPVCSYKNKDKKKLVEHIEDKHQDVLEDKEFTSKQLLYHDRNSDNENIGGCVECKNSVEWNEEKERYPRICNRQKCKDRAHQRHKQNTKEVHGVEYRMRDPEYMRDKILANHKDSKTYKWSRGDIEFTVIGNVEYNVIKKIDMGSNIKHNDIHAPAPFIIEYKTPDGKKHTHYPDFYIESLNLIISCKDGLDNPNTHPNMKKDRLKNVSEYREILNNTDYNYVQIEGESEVESVPDIIKIVRSVKRKGGRYVVPPRIDFMLYGESDTVGNKTINHLIVGCDYEDNPISLFLAPDILSSNNLIHMDGANLITIDGGKTLNTLNCYIINLNEHEIDIFNLYGKIQSFYGDTMIDLVSFELGVPVEYSLKEKLETIINTFGGIDSLDKYEDYIKKYDMLIDELVDTVDDSKLKETLKEWGDDNE